MTGCFLEVNPEGLQWVVIENMFVCHFVDPDLGFQKGGNRIRGH